MYQDFIIYSFQGVGGFGANPTFFTTLSLDNIRSPYLHRYVAAGYSDDVLAATYSISNFILSVDGVRLAIGATGSLQPLFSAVNLSGFDVSDLSLPLNKTVSISLNAQPPLNVDPSNFTWFAWLTLYVGYDTNG